MRGGRRDDAQPGPPVGGARTGDGSVPRYAVLGHGRRRPARADPDRRDFAATPACSSWAPSPCLVTFACLFALRGLDAVSARRAEALALAVARGRGASRSPPACRSSSSSGSPSAAQTCPLPPGVDVVVQGAPAHAFYAVVDGRVVVHRDGGRSSTSDAGDSFGERGLLDNAPRNATVTTEMDTTVAAHRGRRAPRGAPGRPDAAARARPEQHGPAARRRRRGAPVWWTTRTGSARDASAERPWSSSAPATRASAASTSDSPISGARL